MNASLTQIMVAEHTADLQRAARDARVARGDDRARQPTRAPHLHRWLRVRRARPSGRLATSPESCDA